MKRFFLVVLVLTGLPILSGCMAAIPYFLVAAPTAVGIASFRNGKMELKPFEKTSLPNAEKIQLSKKVTVVVPGTISVEFVKSLEAEGLSIITPYKFSELASMAPPTEATERDYSDFAKSAGKKIGADLLFFTNIVNENLEGFSLTQMFISGGTTMNHRLVIRLVSSNGEILWKDEMPYSVTTTGGKSIPEKEINSALASRVIERIKELSLIKPEQKKEEKSAEKKPTETTSEIPLLAPEVVPESNTVVKPAESANFKIIYVKGDSVNLRLGPGVNFKKIGSATQGTKLIVLETRKKWLRVSQDDGRESWIAEQLTESKP